MGGDTHWMRIISEVTNCFLLSSSGATDLQKYPLLLVPLLLVENPVLSDVLCVS